MRHNLTKKRWLGAVACLVVAVGLLWLVGALRQTNRTPASSSSGAGAGAVAGANSSSGAIAAPLPQGGAQASTVPSFTTAVASQAGRYLVRTGTLDLEVAKGQVAAAASRITAITQALGGYVVSSQLSSSGSTVVVPATTVPLVPAGPYAVATVRIPAASYDEAIASFSGLGRVQDLSTSAQDVTGQYVDLGARLSHYQAVEQRLLGFLARTTTVGQALAVQERIDATQLTVEELTGELKALRETVVFSTLTVTVSEKPTTVVAVASRSFPAAFVHSLRLIGVGAQAALVALGAALPFVALAGLLGYGALLIARRARRARGGQASGA